MRVLILVTHLLGAGHLTRAAAIARAFAAQGHETTLVSGGVPQPLISTEGVRVLQLPPVRIAGTEFARLLDEDGEPVTPARLDERRSLLLQVLTETRPHAVLTELFPFGRRVLAAEFLALVEAARRTSPQPIVLASVRDILAAPSKPERIAQTHARLQALYDAVLVHGEERLVPLDRTWPLDDPTRKMLRYTGYVRDRPGIVPGADEQADGGILVSGGSSAAGLPLYRAALGAAELKHDRSWRILVGRGVPEDVFAALRDRAPPNAFVERARPDFTGLLARRAVSVSQAGYNTVVDLLAARVRAVLVPFEAGRETEQRLRAEQLAAAGVATVLPEAELSPSALAACVEAALAMPARSAVDIRLDGASRTVSITEQLLREKRSSGRRRAQPRSHVDEALRRAQDCGETIEVWWRDDDVVAATPALDRLIALAERHNAPLALAAIPASIDPSLPERVAGENVSVLVHGWAHANHARPGQKKSEFGSTRPLADRVADAERGFATISALPAPVVPVFVPPWNRVAADLLPALSLLGFRGISTLGDRARPELAPGLAALNVHFDPIDWRGGRTLLDQDMLEAQFAELIRRRLDQPAAEREPVGLLTHHLVHDEATWRFCDDLLTRLSESGVVRYVNVADMLAKTAVHRADP